VLQFDVGVFKSYKFSCFVLSLFQNSGYPGSGQEVKFYLAAMSVPITERLLLKLKQGHSRPFKEAIREVAALMMEAPGIQSMFWGLHEESSDAAEVLLCASFP
jgi:hypothetical protein